MYVMHDSYQLNISISFLQLCAGWWKRVTPDQTHTSYLSFVFVPSITSFLQASDRVRVMEESNPTFILRNWIAQDSIAAAEAGDFSKVIKVENTSRKVS